MNPPTSDLDRLMSVMEDAFDPSYGEAWSRRQVEDSLMTGHCHYVLVDEEGVMIDDGRAAAGFFLSRSAFGEEELLLLGVRQKYRRRGLASKLLDYLCSSANERGNSKIFLEMRENNSAEFLYRKYGFEPIGRRPKYYRMTNGERIDAITFGLSID